MGLSFKTDLDIKMMPKYYEIDTHLEMYQAMNQKVNDLMEIVERSQAIKSNFCEKDAQKDKVDYFAT